jgi:hypothetical protein
MPAPINFDSSGLQQSTTMTNQNAHLSLASPQSFSSSRIPFSTIRSNLCSGLTSWIQSLAVKVQVSSTLTVSRHDFTLLVFEPVTSTTKVSCHAFALLAFELVTSTTNISSAKTALKATAEMQPSANSNDINNTSSFKDKHSPHFSWLLHLSIGNQKPFQTNYSEPCVLVGPKAKCHSSFS